MVYWKEFVSADRDSLTESYSRNSELGMNFLHPMLFLKASWMERNAVSEW